MRRRDFLVIETSVGRPIVRQFAAFRGGRA